MSDLPDPEAQYNEWACTLACFVWTMKRNGHMATTQQDFVEAHRHVNWEWNLRNNDRRDGLMSTVELIGSMAGADLSVPVRKLIQTNSWQDFLDYHNKNISNEGCAGAYIITRKPTNHCLAIFDLKEGEVLAMDPANEGGYVTRPLRYWEQEHDADFLGFYR